MSRLRLAVRVTLADAPTILEPGSTIRVASHDFRKLGLELVTDWKASELVTAAALADVSLDDVSFVVVAEDGFLKERARLGELKPIRDVGISESLVRFDSQREPVMMNNEGGFSLEVHLVLGSEQTARPLRPHRKGTKLASAFFQISSTRDFGGLDPLPLTKDKLTEFKLLPSTVLYLHNDGPLLDLEHLDRSLEVYVNETLLGAASHHRGEERDAIIGGLAVEAMCQLVHIVHRELQESEIPEGDRSAVLRMIRRALNGAGMQLTVSEVVDMLKIDPARVSGLLSGIDRRARRLVTLVAGPEELENGQER
jgi:hypothetical protein